MGHSFGLTSVPVRLYRAFSVVYSIHPVHNVLCSAYDGFFSSFWQARGKREGRGWQEMLLNLTYKRGTCLIGKGRGLDCETREIRHAPA